MSVRLVLGASATFVVVSTAERFAGLLTVPIATRVLSPLDYGAVLFMTNFGAVANFLVGVSLATALPSLLAGAAGASESRSISTTIVALQLGLFALIYLALALAAPWVASRVILDSEWTTAILTAVLAMFLFSMSQCLIGLLRVFEMRHVYWTVQLPAIVLQTLLVVLLLLGTQLGFAAIYLAMMAAAAFALPIYWYRLRHHLAGRLSGRVAKQAVRIGLPLIPWQGAVFLTTSSAAFYLARYSSLEEAGLFAVANSVASIFCLLAFNFNAVWTPYVLLRKSQPDLDRILVRVFSLSSALLLLSASVLALFAHEIFVLLIGPRFREAYRLVPLLTFAYCIFAFAYCFSQGILIRGTSVHYAWIGLAVIVPFLMLSPSLTVAFGAEGLVVAMAASFLLLLVLVQLAARTVYPVSYPWFRHAALWTASAAGVIPVASLDPSILAFVTKVGMLGGVIMLVLLVGAVKIDDVRNASVMLWNLCGGMLASR
jgi:O-antigen/teichoic acid export membrane protein